MLRLRGGATGRAAALAAFMTLTAGVLGNSNCPAEAGGAEAQECMSSAQEEPQPARSSVLMQQKRWASGPSSAAPKEAGLLADSGRQKREEPIEGMPMDPPSGFPHDDQLTLNATADEAAALEGIPIDPPPGFPHDDAPPPTATADMEATPEDMPMDPPADFPHDDSPVSRGDGTGSHDNETMADAEAALESMPVMPPASFPLDDVPYMDAGADDFGGEQTDMPTMPPEGSRQGTETMADAEAALESTPVMPPESFPHDDLPDMGAGAGDSGGDQTGTPMMPPEGFPQDSVPPGAHGDEEAAPTSS